MKAIRIYEPGETDVLQYEDAPLPEPGPGEVRIRIMAAGVNFIDVYQRSGQYRLDLPFTPGMEGGGVVDAVGEGVTAVSPGNRVAYAMCLGAYAEYAVVPAWKLAHIPGALSLEVATAVMLQGMTAHYLTHSTYALQPGDTALVHAAAGGVGLLLVQIARLRGARVIGTVSTPEKAALALEYGAHDVILYSETDFETEVHRLTEGQGVHVVYDGVGQTTFTKGLNCLKPRGYMVLYGQASGPVASFDPQLLNQKGSLFLTRPSLGHYAATEAEIQQRANELFAWIADDKLRVRLDQTLPLAEAAAAHQYLAARQSKGKVLLKPPVPTDAIMEKAIDMSDPVDEAVWDSFPASDPPSY